MPPQLFHSSRHLPSDRRAVLRDKLGRPNGPKGPLGNAPVSGNTLKALLLTTDNLYAKQRGPRCVKVSPCISETQKTAVLPGDIVAVAQDIAGPNGRGESGRLPATGASAPVLGSERAGRNNVPKTAWAAVQRSITPVLVGSLVSTGTSRPGYAARARRIVSATVKRT